MQSIVTAGSYYAAACSTTSKLIDTGDEREPLRLDQKALLRLPAIVHDAMPYCTEMARAEGTLGGMA